MGDRFSGRLSHWLVNLTATPAVKVKRTTTACRHNDACEQRNNNKMKHSTTYPTAMNTKPSGTCRLLLLGTALLALAPPVQASDWGFNLIGKPSAEITTGEEEDYPEVVEMTGAGRFNPETETASGGGAWAVFNAFAAPFGGPTFRGTWEVTDFVGWTPDGELQVLATLTFNVGLNEAAKAAGLALPNVLVTISDDGINVAVGGGLFATNMTGSARFHLKRP